MHFFFFAQDGQYVYYFFFSSRRRHTRSLRDWSSDVCSSDLTHDLNLYATISKGFRPGGANQILPSGPPINCQPGVLQFGPDSAWNYEVGEKARLLDNRLTINSDFYYIRWLDVQQVITLPCGYQYYNNAGNGRSFGPELEINAKLAEPL